MVIYSGIIEGVIQVSSLDGSRFKISFRCRDTDFTEDDLQHVVDEFYIVVNEFNNTIKKLDKIVDGVGARSILHYGFDEVKSFFDYYGLDVEIEGDEYAYYGIKRMKPSAGLLNNK